MQSKARSSMSGPERTSSSRWTFRENGYGFDRVTGDQHPHSVLDGGQWSKMTIWPETPYYPAELLVRYREWYGTDNPAAGGKGLKLTAEQVGDGIAKREAGDPKLSYGVMDPRAFAEDGGPSIMERVNGRLIAAGLQAFRKADNKRVGQAGSTDARGPMSGWDQMRARILGKAGRPMVYCFDTCVASIRTIPVLQHDVDRPEDLDNSGNCEDHCADEWRYA